MSIEEKLGDTEYFASTDYNQRLEEKAEAEYEEKISTAEQNLTTALNSDIDTLIAEKNINALYELAKEPLAEADALKLASFGDKDIYIALAKNESITDTVALKLIGTVYLVHKALLSHTKVSSDVKEKLKQHLSGTPMYNELLQGT